MVTVGVIDGSGVEVGVGVAVGPGVLDGSGLLPGSSVTTGAGVSEGASVGWSDTVFSEFDAHPTRKAASKKMVKIFFIPALHKFRV